MLFATAAPAFAQEVIVTGSRSRLSGGYSNTADVAGLGAQPVIAMKRTADFAVQQVTIVGDTRDATKRREEIFAMVRSAIGLAGKYGVELATGQYIAEPLTLENYRNLPLSSDGRADTDRVTFLVKVSLAGTDANAVLERIAKFIAAVPAVGRAEMKADDDLSLSVVNPGQYRGAIIDLVATDSATTAGKFGPGYGVQVSGIDRPVQWTRASLTEVYLFRPVSYTVVPKN
jgi:hypothetical protein